MMSYTWWRVWIVSADCERCPNRRRFKSTISKAAAIRDGRLAGWSFGQRVLCEKCRKGGGRVRA